jgi:hypothetical protein
VPRSDDDIDKPRSEERVPLGVRLSRARHAARPTTSGRNLETRDHVSHSPLDDHPSVVKSARDESRMSDEG